LENDCLIEAAESSPGVFKELLNHPEVKSIRATEEVVKAAAGNWGSGKEVVMLLLEKRGDEVEITEEVVKAAAGNEGKAEQITTLLIDRRRSDIHITDNVVYAAATSGQEAVLRMISERLDIPLPEEKWF
jgi:hypothetical protein